MMYTIVFDIDGKLIKTSPNLRQEKNNGLIIFSPSEINSTAWTECCDLVRYCEQNVGFNIEFWFLYAVDNTIENYNHLNLNRYTGEQLIDNAPRYIKEALAKGIIKVRALVWVPLPIANRVDNQIPIEYKPSTDNGVRYLPPVIIKTQLNPDNTFNLGKKFLLPMAIVFLKYKGSLIGSYNTGNLYCELYLCTNHQRLLDCQTIMHQQCLSIKNHLEIDKTYDKYIFNLDGINFYSIKLTEQLTTQIPEFSIDNLGLSYFYNPGEDEATIESWFDNQIQRTLATYSDFVNELNKDYKICLDALNNIQKNKSIDDLGSALGDQTSYEEFSNKHSKDKIKYVKDVIHSKIKDNKKEIESTGGSSEIKSELKQRLNDWKNHNNFPNVVNTLRLRPTLTVLYLTLFLALSVILFVFMYATNNTTSIAQPITYWPMQYRYFLTLVFLTLLFIVFVSLFLLSAKRKKAMTKINLSKRVLSGIHNTICTECRSLIDIKTNELLVQILGKNKNIIENIERTQSHNLEKYNYFMSTVNDYIKYCDTKKIYCKPQKYEYLDPLSNPINCTQLEWPGQEVADKRPEIRKGNTAITYADMPGDLLDKFAGLETITFK